MPKGLRMSEELYREQCAKRSRWQRASEVNTDNGTKADTSATDARWQGPDGSTPGRGAASSPTLQRPPAGTTDAPPLASAAGGHLIAHVVEPLKYRNKPTNGYASKKEAKRAVILRQLRDAGVISDLREQVPYLLIPKAIGPDGRCVERAAKYVADFVYRHGGAEVVEDCKGMRTDAYILKRKLMLMVHGIRITET